MTDPFKRIEGAMQTVDWQDRTVTTEEPTPTEVVLAVDKLLKGELQAVKLYRTKGRRKVTRPASAKTGERNGGRSRNDRV